MVIPTASMTKNTTAHILAPGNWSTTCGYVMNTKPGPLSTTSLTVEPWDEAIKPSILNVITLGMIDVSVLITQVRTASLYVQIVFHDATIAIVYIIMLVFTLLLNRSVDIKHTIIYYIPVAIVMELIERPECRQSADAYTIPEKYLRRPLYPSIRIHEAFPPRGYQILNTLARTFQRHCSD